MGFFEIFFWVFALLAYGFVIIAPPFAFQSYIGEKTDWSYWGLLASITFFVIWESFWVSLGVYIGYMVLGA